MAASFKVGAFTWSGGSSQAITGVGFTPKLVMLFTTRQASHDSFADVSTWCVGFGAGVGSPTQQITLREWNGWVIGIPSASTANEASTILTMSDPLNSTFGSVKLASLDADGFTLEVVAIGFETHHINYVAIGGDDVQVAVGSSTWPTSTGSQSVTDPAFRPSVVFLTASNSSGGIFGGGSSTSFGWVDDGLNQCAMGRHYETNGAPSNSHRYQTSTKCLAILNQSTGAADGLAACTALTDSGFTLNWTAAPASSGTFRWVAITGIESHATQGEQPSSASTQTIATLGVRPRVVIAQSVGMTADGLDDSSRWSLGASDATSHAGIFLGDIDAVANDSNRRNVRRESVTSDVILATPTGVGSGTVNAAAALGNFADDDFDVVWSSADATGRDVFYLALGEASASGGGGGGSTTGVTFPEGLSALFPVQGNAPVVTFPSELNQYPVVRREMDALVSQLQKQGGTFAAALNALEDTDVDEHIQDLLDSITTTRGALLYRGSGGWVARLPGTAGHVLTSNGDGADPSYQAAGSIQDLLDGLAAVVPGVIIYYDGTDWVTLAPGTDGQFLQTQGPTLAPQWATVAPESYGYWSPLMTGGSASEMILDADGDAIMVWSQI
jgi:hypothetical protein